MTEDKTQWIEINLKEQSQCTIVELSNHLNITVYTIIEWVEEGILEPHDYNSDDWVFSMDDIARAKRAARLQQDLSINTAGVALALELMQRIDELENKLQTS